MQPENLPNHSRVVVDNRVDDFFLVDMKMYNVFFSRARLLPSYNPLPQIWGLIFLILYFKKINPLARAARARSARAAQKKLPRERSDFFLACIVVFCQPRCTSAIYLE